MINFIQAAKVKAVSITVLQGIGLSYAPIYQWILLLFTALCLICGNAYIMQCAVICFQAIHFFGNQMRFQLSRTPTYTDSRPTVATWRHALAQTVFDRGSFLFWLIKHMPFKALRMVKRGDMHTTLLI